MAQKGIKSDVPASAPQTMHHRNATTGEGAPDPGGPPTSDVFEGPSGGKGDVHVYDGTQFPAKQTQPKGGGFKW